MDTEETSQTQSDPMYQLNTTFLNDIIPIKNEKDLNLLEQKIKDERFKEFLVNTFYFL